MNNVIYTLLDNFNEYKKLDNKILEKIYDFYMDRCSFYNISFNVDKAIFDEIFITIYDILRFKLSDEEFFDVSKHYLCLLLADARDGYDVDLNWIIKYVYFSKICN